MELSVGGVYFSPLLFAIILGVIVAWLVTRVLNWTRLSRFVWFPPLFFLALAVICTHLIGRFLIPF